ncbi:hypothetical protein IW261DRAFT_1426489 [Armillaria novae-zelandiae]|uniref:Uncharacterized protein n=1 Tax=Armillaria novae-zelandiae TaxID=153914 RepID=A0AA39U5R6_9AGAR|nr:hypothetical protein IW261DRAFT_1426489 [Armillaria novae-zelandiae]
MGQVGARPLIEDSLQILKFSPKTVALARSISMFTVQMFMAPCMHAGPDRANSMQSLVSQSLWKCPRPQEWTFSPGDEVSVQAQLSLPGRVIEIQDTGLDIYCLYIGKYFRVNECVKFLSEDNWGSLGCIQCIDDMVAIDVFILPENTKEINVWHNAVALANPPKAFAALAPEKIMEKMYTGKTPWQGINVIILPSNDPWVTTAHLYKGQVGTVLDVLLKQLGLSSLRVCVCLLQTYRAASGFTDVWLDYDEVIEEITGLPLWYCLPLLGHQLAFMPSRQYEHSGNKQKNVEHGQAWAVPGIPLHQIPSVATGTSIPHLHSSNGTHWVDLPNEAHLLNGLRGDFDTINNHQTCRTKCPGLGKAVHGTHYVEGSKPTKWWVREVSIQSGKVDKFVGEAWEVVSSDMCVTVDSNDDYQMNLSWAQSQCKAPSEKLLRQGKKDSVVHISLNLLPMVPKSSFPTDQEDWIKKCIAEYIPKTAYGKVWEHGKPAPEDDTGLSTWVENKVADLEKAFPEFYQALEPKKLEDMRKKFTAKFCNAKNDEKEHLHKWFFNAYMALPFLPTSSNTCLSASLPGVPMAPTIDQAETSKFSLLNPIPMPTGRNLFLAEQKEEINVAIYDALSEEEKGLWAGNQHRLIYELTCLLNGLIGLGANQVGHAAFTLLWGFCDENKMVQLGSVLSASDQILCFPDVDQAMWDGITDDWTAYLNRSTKRCNATQFDPPASSSFPSFTEETSVSDLQVMVKTFWEQQWSVINAQPILWSAIKANRSMYVSGDVLTNVPIGDPDRLSKGNIINIADYFKDRVVAVFLPQVKTSPTQEPDPGTDAGKPALDATKWAEDNLPSTQMIVQMGGRSIKSTSMTEVWEKVTGGGIAMLKSQHEHTYPLKGALSNVDLKGEENWDGNNDNTGDDEGTSNKSEDSGTDHTEVDQRPQNRGSRDEEDDNDTNKNGEMGNSGKGGRSGAGRGCRGVGCSTKLAKWKAGTNLDGEASKKHQKKPEKQQHIFFWVMQGIGTQSWNTLLEHIAIRTVPIVATPLEVLDVKCWSKIEEFTGAWTQLLFNAGLLLALL